MATLSERKEEIISAIEADRGGLAFDDDVHRVLKGLTEAELFVLQKAFMETFKAGVTSGEG